MFFAVWATRPYRTKHIIHHKLCITVSDRFFSAQSVRTIGVVGAGQMGTGIALTAARNGVVNVLLTDSDAHRIKATKSFIDTWVSQQATKGKLVEPAEAVTRRITLIEDLELLNKADLIIEAVVESAEVKQRLLAQLDEIAKPEAILASNTSSISISLLGAATRRPEQVIGMHFMNPVPVMPLIELIPGLATSQQTVDKAKDVALHVFRKEIAFSLDRPGFVSNRILMPYINEAIFALQDGIASAEDIDKIMKFGTNVPMGPLTLADFIGLDTCLSIIRVLHTELGDSKYRPAPLLVQYVNAGWLGRKAKRGFYTY